MDNMLYKFLNDKNVLYPLQFSFRQKYSTYVALIHLTESIKEAFDQGKYVCGIFAYLRKTFDASISYRVPQGF